MGATKLGGNPVKVFGELPAVGKHAPDFRLVRADLVDVSLADFAGKKKLISIVPSLDTGICAKSTRIFNERCGGRADVVLIIVSADLPFAQTRYCESAKTEHVVALSMMRDRHFAKDYGVLMEDGPMAGITARAVLVLDTDDTVLHAELVPEIGQEPDYDRALAALG